MAYADDMMVGSDQNSGSEYPSAFGIQFTPKVTGIIIAVVGLAGAGYLFANYVQPVWQKNDALKTEIQTEEAKILQPEEIEQRLQQAQAKRQSAAQKKNTVLTLFANESNLRTLLLDLNQRIENRNTGLKPDDVKAKLTKFQPDPKLSGVINDSSYGTTVNNELARDVYNVELEGTFAQTNFFMVDLERLKPLLVVKNLKSELNSTDRIRVYRQQGRLEPVKVNEQANGQPLARLNDGKPVLNPARKIKTSFQLQALRPLTAEEKAKLQPAPAPGTQPVGEQTPAK